MARWIRIITTSLAKHESKGLSPSNTKHTKRGEFEPKNARRKGRTKTQHTRVNLKPISFMNLRGIHLYKARAYHPIIHPLD